MNIISVPLFRNGVPVKRLQITAGAKGALFSLGDIKTEKGNPVYENSTDPAKYIGMMKAEHMAVVLQFIKKAKNDIMPQEEADDQND